MLSQIFYFVRSKQDGQYLVARPRTTTSSNPDNPTTGYVLLFREHSDALSYLNTHGSGVSDRFAVESIPSTQLKGMLQRWGFDGIGLVEDPLLPRVEFLTSLN
ncbi:hypothetical protein H6G89_13615 [Oscillatoria sp. FACHB-1407]|uniref:hypothetical protein n=1 Tax=Oscillatoria sp. FACHB-1407 TaxID=2692847 RepID=UPI0016884166|nr:hypothetical protein [Oscillatoria sp. FACHB-1407]MBD2462087.1 hypothetical protein [Oscillatoria sp. FACHB-1407]